MTLANSNQRVFQWYIKPVKCEERFEVVTVGHRNPTNDKPEGEVHVERKSLGWWVTFDNHISIPVGKEDPKVKLGIDSLLQLQVAVDD